MSQKPGFLFRSCYNSNIVESIATNEPKTLKLDDNVFTAIQEQAEASGISPELLAANLLKQQFEDTFKQRINKAEKVAARERFESHFGEILS